MLDHYFKKQNFKVMTTLMGVENSFMSIKQGEYVLNTYFVITYMHFFLKYRL